MVSIMFGKFLAYCRTIFLFDYLIDKFHNLMCNESKNTFPYNVCGLLVAFVAGALVFKLLCYCCAKCSNNNVRRLRIFLRRQPDSPDDEIVRLYKLVASAVPRAVRYLSEPLRHQPDSSNLNDKIVRLYTLVAKAVPRAVVLQAVIDLREHSLDQPPDMMERFHELVVNIVLDPTASSLIIRTDVDLDLHKVRKQDAKALVKLLLRKTHDNDLRPETGASDNLIPHLANENELYE